MRKRIDSWFFVGIAIVLFVLGGGQIALAAYEEPVIDLAPTTKSKWNNNRS